MYMLSSVKLFSTTLSQLIRGLYFTAEVQSAPKQFGDRALRSPWPTALQRWDPRKEKGLEGEKLRERGSFWNAPSEIRERTKKNQKGYFSLHFLYSLHSQLTCLLWI